jgi:hypothetical protein
MAVYAAMVGAAQGQTCAGMSDGTSCAFSQCMNGVCISQDCFSAGARLYEICERPPPATAGNTGGRCDAAGACVDPAQVSTPTPTTAPTRLPTDAPTPSPTAAPTISANFRQPRPQSCSGRPDQSLCSHDSAPCAEARCIGGLCYTASPYSSMPDDAPCTNCTAAGCDVRTCASGQCLAPANDCSGHAQGVSCNTGGCVVGRCDGAGGCAVGTVPELKPAGSTCAFDDAFGIVTAGLCTSAGQCAASLGPTATPSSASPTMSPTSPAPTVATAAPVAAVTTMTPTTQAPVSTGAPTHAVFPGFQPIANHVLLRCVCVMPPLLTNGVVAFRLCSPHVMLVVVHTAVY